MNPSVPDLSVVLACTDRYPTIAATLAHLAAQSIHERIEVVLVAKSRATLDMPTAAVEGFWGHQVVEIGTFDSIAYANAAGARHARAPVIAFSEDHCFPEHGWAAALLRAHEGPYAAVGPVVRNANPGTAVSWADYLIGYGPWAYPCPSGEAPFLAGHNSSYKRAALLDYGERLEEMLAAETVMHVDLRARGERLYVCADARSSHVNFSRVGSWLAVQIHNGRVFAATRAHDWSVAHRAFYALASPLIPPVRMARATRSLLALRRPASELARVLPVLALGLLLDGVGQLLGYAFGAGNSARALTHYEFRRIDHVRPEERALFSGVVARDAT
jgi:hypothetical protein